MTKLKVKHEGSPYQWIAVYLDSYWKFKQLKAKLGIKRDVEFYDRLSNIPASKLKEIL